MTDRITHEPHRITPTKESLGYMKFFRDKLPSIQQEIPQVKGLGFFGSRVVGKERKSLSHKSDLDIVVFYDGSEFEVDDSPFITEKFRNARRGRLDLLFNIEKVATNLMRELRLPLNRDAIGQNATIQTIDISSIETDRALEMFVNYADANTNRRSQEITPERMNIIGNTFPLISRFLLGIGENLYKNRAYVLNKLEAMENGEYYFRGMMNCLKGIQEVKHQQGKLPQTISEAYSYFRVQ